MTEIKLEQQIVFVRAWLQKAQRLHAEPERMSDRDLPPGSKIDITTFLERQYQLALEARENIKKAIEACRSSQEDTIAIASYRRLKLAEHIESGQMGAKEANKKASELSGDIDAATSKKQQCDFLLQQIHSEEPCTTPNLPLFQYPLRWRAFEEEQAADPPSEKERPEVKSRPKDSGKAFWNRLSPSDRIAVVAAILLSLCIVTGGFMYMYVWGKITLEVTALDRYNYSVRCINTYGEAIAFQAPYDGAALPRETPTVYGLSATLITKKGERKALPRAVWYYKDLSADLYGSIFAPAVDFVELNLQLTPDEIPDEGGILRLTVFKAPKRAKTTARIEIPPRSEDTPSVPDLPPADDIEEAEDLEALQNTAL
ncbi:MAG: hypothetical protein ACOYI9_12830 [Candidatus Hydrogenedentales bacterium]